MHSPVSLATPVQFDDDLPEQVDVVVVGGGIIGISAAQQLAERGQRVVVLEKGRVAGEQSSRNWGWVRQTGRDAAELPIMMESNRIWRDLAASTGENSLAFHQQGVLYLADTEADMIAYEEFSQLALTHGLECRLLSSSEVATQLPDAGHRWLGGLTTPSDGRVEPWFAVPALARAVQRTGVSIIENCAAIEVEQASGAVSAVVSEKGRVNCAQVLVAGGAWSSALLQRAGISLPQLSVKSTVMRVENLPDSCTSNCADGDIAFARRADGAHTVALNGYHEFYIGPDAFRHLLPYRQAALSSWHTTHFRFPPPAHYPDSWNRAQRRKPMEFNSRSRLLNPEPDARLVDKMVDLLGLRFPDCDIKPTHLWAGLIDTLPDFVPVLDESPLSGLFIATGFSGHGFGIGPGAGRVMADLMLQNPVEHALDRFRFSRFSDGSKLMLGPH
ncbi:MAG: FAD-binding oxidoreductase [Gammaproteobacteria bacterium]|nr:FAD-binding oxidoreductase [Gammaproteobacteria bacterium]